MPSSVADTASVPDASFPSIETPPGSRREFLNYLLGGSLALLAAEACAVATWFALPHFRFGEESGVFLLDLSMIPAVGMPPVAVPEVKSWLSNTSNGLLALEMHCVFDHRPIAYEWVRVTNRFECPGCGSKFRANGEKLDGLGPARRNLDRFPIEVTTATGTLKTSPDGNPVDTSGATQLVVDTRYKILGKPI